MSIRYDKVEALIEKVRERRPIWDIRATEHANRALVNHCWKEISNEMGVDEGVLRKKWKYLRDQFTVEKSKLKTKKSEETDSTKDSGWPGTATEPKWNYYKELLFLKDVVRMRPYSRRHTKHTDNSSDEEDDSNDSDSKNLNQTKTDILDDEIPPSIVEITVPTGNQQASLSSDVDKPAAKKQRFSAKSARNEKLADLDESRRENDNSVQVPATQPEQENDNILFFKSLLPYVNKIPFKSKLRFRNRIQEVVEEFAFAD